jgi:hypothetical protein
MEKSNYQFGFGCIRAAKTGCSVINGEFVAERIYFENVQKSVIRSEGERYGILRLGIIFFILSPLSGLHLSHQAITVFFKDIIHTTVGIY